MEQEHLKKRPAVDWKVRRRVNNKNPSAGPRCCTAIAFRLSPGNCQDAPEGEAWLKDIDCPFPGGPMIIDRADEGDTTRQLALDLIFSAVLFLPNRMALILGSMTKSCTKREMKWNDCSAG